MKKRLLIALLIVVVFVIVASMLWHHRRYVHAKGTLRGEVMMLTAGKPGKITHCNKTIEAMVAKDEALVEFDRPDIRKKQSAFKTLLTESQGEKQNIALEMNDALEKLEALNEKKEWLEGKIEHITPQVKSGIAAAERLHSLEQEIKKIESLQLLEGVRLLNLNKQFHNKQHQMSHTESELRRLEAMSPGTVLRAPRAGKLIDFHCTEGIDVKGSDSLGTLLVDGLAWASVPMTRGIAWKLERDQLAFVANPDDTKERLFAKVAGFATVDDGNGLRSAFQQGEAQTGMFAILRIEKPGFGVKHLGSKVPVIIDTKSSS